MLCDVGDQVPDRHADADRPEDVQRGGGHVAEGARVEDAHLDGGGQHQLDQAERGDQREEHGEVVPRVQGALDGVGVGGSLVGDPDKPGADDGGEDADTRDGHRKKDRSNAPECVGYGAAIVADDVVAQHHGGEHGGHVGTEEICTHAGDVAHVVAHVVGDGRGIAGIILGDSGLDLADEVSSDVGGLGVDAAAHAGEEGDRLGSEGEAGQNLEHAGHSLIAAAGCEVAPHELVEENDEEGTDAEHGQTGHAESHHGTAAKGDLQGLGEGGLCGLGGADVRLGGDLHAEESREGGEETADHKAGHDQDARVGGHLRNLREDAETGTRDHHVHAEDPVFGLEEGHGPLGNVGCDSRHLGIAGILLGDPTRKDRPVHQGDESQDGDEINEMFHNCDLQEFTFRMTRAPARRLHP